MFERFTRDARQAVVEAQQTAHSAGADRIRAEHLLLGATADPASVAARALATLGIDPSSLAESVRAVAPDALDADALAGVGIDLKSVRAQAEATFGRGALDGDTSERSGRVPFDATAKKLLEIALREAARFRSNRIDTGHLLLAAASLDGTPAQRALAWFGPDRAAMERAIIATWAEGTREDETPDSA